MTDPKPSRREFLKASAGVVAGASVASGAAVVKATEEADNPLVVWYDDGFADRVSVVVGPEGWQCGEWLTIRNLDLAPVKTGSDIVYATALHSAEPGEHADVLMFAQPMTKARILNSGEIGWESAKERLRRFENAEDLRRQKLAADYLAKFRREHDVR